MDVQTSVAQRWVARWDVQQERYVADREERFHVVADVVTWSLNRSGGTGRILDLGCGPGSLGTRLSRALPGAEIVGVDVDPLLLGLAGSADGMRAVHADLTDPAWPDVVDLDGPWDAVVSSTALHWLAAADLATLYATVASHLRPGGVLVDADHRALDGPDATDLARHVREARAVRAGVTDNEDWRSWWDGVRIDPELAPLLEARSDATIAHSGENGLTLGEQRAMLLAAGFTTVTPVWQVGDDHVLVAIR